MAVHRVNQFQLDQPNGLMDLRRHLDISKTPFGTKCFLNSGETNEEVFKNELDNFCFYFNMEPDVKNLSNKDLQKDLHQERDQNVRYYEQETIRLVKSLRSKHIWHNKIRIICIIEDKNYKPDTLKFLDDNGVEVLKHIPKREFHCGYDKIPYYAEVMANNHRAFRNTCKPDYLFEAVNSTSQLIFISNYNKKIEDIWGNCHAPVYPIPEHLIKLDNDMVLLKALPKVLFNTMILNPSMVITGIYDKDQEPNEIRYQDYEDEKIRVIDFNTCFLAFGGETRLPIEWSKKLSSFHRVFKDRTGIYHSDAEEISFGLAAAGNNELLFFGNFQIGPNYLNSKELSSEELSKIYFYHGPLNPDSKLDEDANPLEHYIVNIYSEVQQRVHSHSEKEGRFGGMYYKEMNDVEHTPIPMVAYYNKFNWHLNDTVKRYKESIENTKGIKGNTND